jgi:hypothetical protein
MVPFRKKKNGQVLQTPKPAGKTVEKPVEKPVEKSLNKIDTQTIELIETIEDICDDYGWALGDVGNLIVKKPEFDPRNYGFAKLTPMLKSLTDILEIDEENQKKRH